MNIDIYSKDGCPFCVQAKDFLRTNNVAFIEHDLTNDDARHNFYQDTGTTSVPQIYIDDQLIGGYDELMKVRSRIEGPRLLQPKEAYVFDYPPAVKFAEQQKEVFWLPDEIKVEKDVQDINVNCSEAERHGVITVLKLFTLYELMAGDEYWGGRVKDTFPRPDIRMMASTFQFFELGVHAPFYNKLNEALHLNNEEFYMSYVDDPVLKARMKFVDDMVNHEDILTSLAVFSMIEGAVLYSSFAFLKHFQSKGKNKLLNVVRGINFSVRDENLHCLGGAWLYQQLKSELEEARMLGNHEAREKRIVKAAEKIYQHECRVVDMIFEKGDIEGITPTQMKHFIESRIDECMVNINMPKLYKPSYNPIASYFYDGINGYQFGDFFSGITSEYNRNWNEAGFTWGEQDV